MPPTADDEFSAAYSRYLPAVSAYLARRVERQHVEDLAADVFAVAWQKRGSVKAGEELPWLYRVAANLLANHRRRETSGAAIVKLLRNTDSAPSAEDIVIADQSLAEAWKQLKAKDREVLALATFEELAVGDIARALGVSNNAVSIRLSRSRKQLAELLKD